MGRAIQAEADRIALSGLVVNLDEDGDTCCPLCEHYVQLNCQRGGCGCSCTGCGCREQGKPRGVDALPR